MTITNGTERRDDIFWPPRDEAEEHLYEIRNGKTLDYVQAHVDSLRELWISEAQHGWTCFHCNERFTDEAAAAEHFGETGLQRPACAILSSESQGLLKALRESEREVGSLRHANEQLGKRVDVNGNY